MVATLRKKLHRLADVQILIFCNMISNSSGRIPLLIFCTYLQQQFFNVADARSGEYKLPAQQQALPLAAIRAIIYSEARNH